MRYNEERFERDLLIFTVIDPVDSEKPLNHIIKTNVNAIDFRDTSWEQ